ncbi:MAG: hypothetical protein ABIU05_07210 [Nitrospirales bacterium]
MPLSCATAAFDIPQLEAIFHGAVHGEAVKESFQSALVVDVVVVVVLVVVVEVVAHVVPGWTNQQLVWVAPPESVARYCTWWPGSTWTLPAQPYERSVSTVQVPSVSRASTFVGLPLTATWTHHSLPTAGLKVTEFTIIFGVSFLAFWETEIFHS